MCRRLDRRECALEGRRSVQDSSRPPTTYSRFLGVRRSTRGRVVFRDPLRLSPTTRLARGRGRIRLILLSGLASELHLVGILRIVRFVARTNQTLKPPHLPVSLCSEQRPFQEPPKPPCR